MKAEKRAEKTKKHTEEQKSTLRVSLTTAFITTFMGSALNLAIPDMGEYFDVSAAFLGWIVTAYMLAVATMSVPFGKIADTTGRRRVMILGILFFTLFNIISVFAPNMATVIVLRTAQGVAGAMIFATNTAILISAFPGKERGKVLGKMTAATYIGLSAGPFMGGFLNHYLGWQSIFATAALVGIFAFVTAVRKLPGGEKLITEGRHDYAGSILYVAMIILTMYGLSNITSGRYAWIWVLAGMVAGIFFVLVELRAANPVIQVRIFISNMVYTLSNIAALLNYGATFAIGYLMSIYLQVVMGYDSQTAGLILVTQPLIQAFFSPMAGRWSDRTEPYKLASAGMGICALCLFFFSSVSLETPLWAIISALCVTGFGFALFSSPNTNAVMACIKPKDYSVASSILATMRSLGHTSSMSLVTVIVGAYMGTASLASARPELLIKTMHMAFIVFTGLCIVGILMSLKRKTASEK